MTRPAHVLVAVVEVAVKCDATTSPTTASFAYGEVVPIPTLPLERMVSFELSLTPIMREFGIVLMIFDPIAVEKLPLTLLSRPSATVETPLEVFRRPIEVDSNNPLDVLNDPKATPPLVLLFPTPTVAPPFVITAAPLIR